MSKKSATKKVRGSALAKGMTLATGEKILSVSAKGYLGAPGTLPWTIMHLVLDGGPDGKGGTSAGFGSSEWVEILREQA